jgi:hypothetical protein
MPQSLLENPGHDTKLEILSTFFHTKGAVQLQSFYKTYFEYYERELKRLRIGIAPPLWIVSTLAAKSHEDVLHIARTLSTQKCSTRPVIRELLRLRFKYADDLAIDRSIDLTLRLWLMLNVRDPQLRVLDHQKPALHWQDDCSLEEFVTSQFPPSIWSLEARESRLDPFFTAANMARICGLKLEWTESLEDHLRLDRRDKVLRIYPYKNALVGHLDCLDSRAGDTKG